MDEDEVVDDVDDAIPDDWLNQQEEESEAETETEEAAEETPVEAPDVPVQASQAAAAPPARYSPQIGPVWGETDDAALDAAFESMDPTRMREAVKSALAKTYQTAIQHAALLNGGVDPIEDRVRHNMSIMAATNPNALSDPRAREMAEFAAVQQYAQETGKTTHEAMREYWDRKNPAPKPTAPAPTPKQTAPRTLPPAMRTPAPGVAPQGTGARPQRTSSEKVARILSQELDMEIGSDFLKDLEDSRKRITLRTGGRR